MCTREIHQSGGMDLKWIQSSISTGCWKTATNSGQWVSLYHQTEYTYIVTNAVYMFWWLWWLKSPVAWRSLIQRVELEAEPAMWWCGYLECKHAWLTLDLQKSVVQKFRLAFCGGWCVKNMTYMTYSNSEFYHGNRNHAMHMLTFVCYLCSLPLPPEPSGIYKCNKQGAFKVYIFHLSRQTPLPPGCVLAMIFHSERVHQLDVILFHCYNTILDCYIINGPK